MTEVLVPESESPKAHSGGLAKVGLKPGAVVYVGVGRDAPVSMSVIDYSENELEEAEATEVGEAIPFLDGPTITWIDVIGVHDSQVVEQLGTHLNIHPLVLEDIVNTHQRPKVEDLQNYVFVALKMLYHDGATLVSEQISVLWGPSWVVTFQEVPGDVLELVRKRLKKTVPRIRFMHSDYLAYAIIDAIVDHYFIVLERIGNEIEELDDRVSDDPTHECLVEIRNMKRQLLTLRKAIWPLREAVSSLSRADNKLIHEETEPYLRDLYEHVIQVIDTVETYRDTVSGLVDLYHTSVSNRMNEIMKVLTIFSTIFIPLGFVAGVYGMNFDTGASPYNLPELGLRFGYIGFWVLVGCVVLGLLYFFRRKQWL